MPQGLNMSMMHDRIQGQDPCYDLMHQPRGDVRRIDRNEGAVLNAPSAGLHPQATYSTLA